MWTLLTIWYAPVCVPSDISFERHRSAWKCCNRMRMRSGTWEPSSPRWHLGRPVTKVNARKDNNESLSPIFLLRLVLHFRLFAQLHGFAECGRFFLQNYKVRIFCFYNDLHWICIESWLCRWLSFWIMDVFFFFCTHRSPLRRSAFASSQMMHKIDLLLRRLHNLWVRNDARCTVYFLPACTC